MGSSRERVCLGLINSFTAGSTDGVARVSYSSHGIGVLEVANANGEFNFFRNSKS